MKIGNDDKIRSIKKSKGSEISSENSDDGFFIENRESPKVSDDKELREFKLQSPI